MARLPAEYHARIVGAGPEAHRLQRLAKELGLVDRVTWLRMVPSEQMPAEFACFDCLVLPSRTRPNWKEQFGRVLIEAMACGVPVVGSNSGEIPNVIGQAGLIFAEDDAAALAERLRQLREQPETGARLAALGRQRVQAGYTQRHVAQASVAFYRDILNDGYADRLVNPGLDS